MPPYWFLQRCKVASLMASCFAISGVETPAASFSSAWRSLRTICSGVCLLFIESPPFPAPFGLSDSHSSWISFRGACHLRLGEPLHYLAPESMVYTLVCRAVGASCLVVSSTQGKGRYSLIVPLLHLGGVEGEALLSFHLAWCHLA